MPSSRHAHPTLLSTILTTRRGAIALTVSLFVVYCLVRPASPHPSAAPLSPARSSPFASAASDAATTNDARGGDAKGLTGWAKEYWNGGGRVWRWNANDATRGRDRLEAESASDPSTLPSSESTRQGSQRSDASDSWQPAGLDRADEPRYSGSDDDDEEEYPAAGEFAEGARRIGRPFGKGTLDSDDGAYGEDEDRDRARGGRKPSQLGNGHRLAPLASAEEEALADSPRIANEEDAVDRAPMAALPTSDETGATQPSSNDVPLADHAAKVPVQPHGADDSGPQHEALARPKAVVAGRPKKIGTGGKVVRPDRPLAPAGVGPLAAAVGGAAQGGEKAGKVVQAEAGRRVGTGARPGAKGMGLEQVPDPVEERRQRRVVAFGN
ncbi:hypothetical protein JCM10212_001037 [Sporobolomyces blumeae]